MVTQPQGRLFSWENTVMALAEDKAFSAISVSDAQGIFFPLYVSVHACAWNIGASLCHDWDWWQLCECECVITEQTSCICPAMCFQAQSCSFGLVLPLGATPSWRGVGFLLPVVSTGTGWVGSHSSKCCTPLSVVRQTSAAGMCGMFLWFASSQPCIAAHVKYWNAVFLLLLTFKNLSLMLVFCFVSKIGPGPFPHLPNCGIQTLSPTAHV